MKKLDGKVKIGWIGLGARGDGMLKMTLRCFGEAEVTAVCDIYEDRTNKAASIVESRRGNKPFRTADYREVIAREDVNCIFVTTAWEDHIKIALDAMEAGKFVAMEVGGAYSVEDCWKLIDTYERTGTHCMMLENCCYGEDEMMVLNMVRKGILGMVVHCEGGYMHDCREEIAFGNENRHYRLRNYIARNCENYPTHELGPIAKILDINRGNRMTSMVSVSSKAEGMAEYCKRNKKVSEEVRNATFKQGDVVVTTIKCENGETIVLRLDTTLPRTYSRNFSVSGTKGMFREDNGIVAIDGAIPARCHFNSQAMWGNRKKYRRKYNNDIWKKEGKKVARLGHGGMDYYVVAAALDACKNGLHPPIDAYDTAAWMAISPLSEISIKTEKFVEIPDFTRGKYKTERKDKNTSIFALDK